MALLPSRPVARERGLAAAAEIMRALRPGERHPGLQSGRWFSQHSGQHGEPVSTRDRPSPMRELGPSRRRSDRARGRARRLRPIVAAPRVWGRRRLGRGRPTLLLFLAGAAVGLTGVAAFGAAALLLGSRSPPAALLLLRERIGAGRAICALPRRARARGRRGGLISLDGRRRMRFAAGGRAAHPGAPATPAPVGCERSTLIADRWLPARAPAAWESVAWESGGAARLSL